MKMLRSTLLGLLLVAAVAAGTFAIAVAAMRPYSPIGSEVKLTPQELWFSALIALVAGVITAWRMLRGEDAKGEAKRITDGVINSEDLG